MEALNLDSLISLLRIGNADFTGGLGLFHAHFKVAKTGQDIWEKPVKPRFAYNLSLTLRRVMTELFLDWTRGGVANV